MSSKSESKKENSESWESLFRKTLSKDRLLTFTRPADNPIQWIHLLDPFDQQDTRTVLKSTATREGLANESSLQSSHNSGDKLPHLKFPEAVVALAQAAAKASGETRAAGSMDLSGWPLIPFSKVQMFKCEKCCLEFYSPVNHRRHLRVIHRRAVNAEKEDLRSQRQHLASFWDSLSPQEASKIVDMKNLTLEDLTGEKVARALSHLLQQPGLFSLPHSYVKSGTMLLELVQCRSSRLLLTSSELFKILDGSSEKTFPSFGLNAMQRYVFEGGAGKVGLEAKNLVSALGFLVELNLVKAFIKDKDEEAWRCQAALVEEEEAFQRKRAQIEERKRMKKARQRDLKEKEQKPLDATTASLSAGSDSSDDEESRSAVGYNLHSRPSSNAFENLYHRLAGEGSDSDHQLDALSTQMSGPFVSNHSPGEPGEDDDSNNDSEAVVSKALQEHDSTKSMFSVVGKVDLEHEALEGGAQKSSFEASVQASSGLKKPHFEEKRKYPTERNSEEGRDLFFPIQKHAWKVRPHSSARSFIGKTVAKNFKEEMDVVCPEVVLEDSSANRAAGFHSRPLVGKPVRARKYHTSAQTGAAVWTKKALKHSDTACGTTLVHADIASHSKEDISEHILSEAPEASAVVSAVDNLHDGVSAIIQSGALDGGFCCHESHSSDALSSDLDYCNEPCQAGHALSSLSSVVVGSVVIGSVSVSLVDSMVGQDQVGMQFKSLENKAEGREVVEASEGATLVHLTGKLEESFRALHENGAINCVPHREPERNGKIAKLSSQVDSEEKENHEHCVHLAGEGKSSRATVFTQGANSRGGRLKVWRPVVSSSSHDSQGRLGSSIPVSTDVVTPTNQSITDGKESENSINEFERFEPTSEDNRVCSAHETASDKECVRGEGNEVEEGSTVSASTVEAIKCFLSQRWYAAVNDPDTVFLSLEDDEECEGQSEDANVHVSDVRNSSLQANKDTPSNPGNGKSNRGFWKQGCSGSAMNANQRLSGKNNNIHGAPRFTGYRYVPK